MSAPSCGPCPRRTACQDPAGHSESEGDVKGRETAGPGKFAARLIKAKQEPLAVGLGGRRAGAGVDVPSVPSEDETGARSPRA